MSSYNSTVFKKTGELLSKALLLSRALFLVLLAPIVIIFSIPIYILRYGLSTWAKYFSSGTIIEPISASGNMFSPELDGSLNHRPPRCAIVCTITLKGIISTEKLAEKVKSRWLSEYNGNGKGCRYPELKQYADSWFGFMFWKRDDQFEVENHIKSHKIQGQTDK